MKIRKEKTEFGLNIFLEEEEKYLTFSYCGNLDLYWSIHSKHRNINDDYTYDYFIITKENYGIYYLFEKLFYDIENLNIFDIEDDIISYTEPDKKIKYLEDPKKEIEKEREKYRLYNISNYNELFDKDRNTITWYSDETAHEVSNILKIKKEKNIFKVEFYIQPYIKGYDRDFHSTRYIPIRFRNSGSKYDPFNCVFMRMYNNMHDIDDINDIGHQIHIEEYLVDLDKVKKLTK